ncbi:MAG TPA: ShlB/FhaC/HecB family hemolysin secretion/activation protein [Rhizomicrobium sp.]|nr:ShlB/FhaC/HecB family hemolysin secretion/activation protein [Rhizomicrobium sp.]
MRGLVAFVIVMLSAGTAAAQTVSPFIIDQNRVDRAPPAPAPSTPALPQAPAAAIQAAAKPFTLTGVTIQGVSIAPRLLEAAVKPFIGKTTDTAGLTAIANAVSDAYGHGSDIALYTVTVPAQDFAGGLARLSVTEGFIEHVDIGGDTAQAGLVSDYARKLTVEKPLRRSTLQRYLSLMRDVPGLSVDAQLLRATTPGGVRLVLTLHQKSHFVKVSLNDAGASLLGRYQGEVDLSLYGLLRDGEESKLSFGTSTIFSRYQYYGASDSEAVDDEGTRAQLALGYLRTDIGAVGLSGAARTAQLLVSHPLIRGFDEKLSIGADIDGIDTDNAILGNAVSNEHTRALRATASYSLSDPDWLLALSGSLSQGLDGLGARATLPGLSDAGFEKLVLGANYNHLLGPDWVVRLKAITQIASTRLPVSELYALGGGDFGKAYLVASSLGDSALAGAAELAWQPKDWTGLFAGTELFGFGDDGQSWYRQRIVAAGTIAAQDYNLASAGFGVRFPYGTETKLELAAADALSSAPGTRAGEWRFLFGLTSGL